MQHGFLPLTAKTPLPEHEPDADRIPCHRQDDARPAARRAARLGLDRRRRGDRTGGRQDDCPDFCRGRRAGVPRHRGGGDCRACRAAEPGDRGGGRRAVARGEPAGDPRAWPRGLAAGLARNDPRPDDRRCDDRQPASEPDRPGAARRDQAPAVGPRAGLSRGGPPGGRYGRQAARSARRGDSRPVGDVPQWRSSA